MNGKRLGESAICVSDICMSTMTFGGDLLTEINKITKEIMYAMA